jgi:3-oxoacyl-[acyl-carrier protein] reductase
VRPRRSCFSVYQEAGKLPDKRFIRVQAPSSERRAGPAGSSVEVDAGQTSNGRSRMNDEASGAKPLLDRVAIVTGSGQGIGRRVAMCLARARAHVVIADQVPERIASVTSAIEDLVVQALGVATDVSRSHDVKRMIRQTVDRFGKIDILVNNAGTLVVKPMVEQTERGMGPRARRQSQGRLSLLSPRAARDDRAQARRDRQYRFDRCVPHHRLACSLRRFQSQSRRTLTRDLAYEVGRLGIRVSAIAPGPIETPMVGIIRDEQRQAIAKTSS